MEETDASASSVQLIIQVLHEEQQWDSISELFLEYLTSNNSCTVTVNATASGANDKDSQWKLEKLSSIWKTCSTDQIFEYWNQWKILLSQQTLQEDLFSRLITIIQPKSDTLPISSHIHNDHDQRQYPNQYYSPTIVNMETRQNPPKIESQEGQFQTKNLNREACTTDFHPLGPMSTIIDNNVSTSSNNIHTSSNVAQQEMEPLFSSPTFHNAAREHNNIPSNARNNPQKDHIHNNNNNPFNNLLKKSQEIDYDDVTNKITNAALWVQQSVSDNPLLQPTPKSMELKDFSSVQAQTESNLQETTNNSHTASHSSKSLQQADHSKNIKNDMEDIVAYSSSARKSTESMKVWTRNASLGVKNVATSGIINLANQWEEHKIGEKIIPSEKHRVMVSNVGKVGLAGLGATAMVTEALFQGTIKAAEKGVEATANVVRDKCGEEAGQVVEDTGKTITNVFQTVRLASTTLNVNRITRSIARNTAKEVTMNKSSLHSLSDSKEDLDATDHLSDDSDSDSFESVSGEFVDRTANKIQKSDLDMLIESSADFDSEDDEDENDDVALPGAQESGHLKQE